MVQSKACRGRFNCCPYISSLRYYLDIGLGIFFKGVGMDVLWPQAAAMGGTRTHDFVFGWWRF